MPEENICTGKHLYHDVVLVSLLLTLNIFPFSSVSVVAFEQANVYWICSILFLVLQAWEHFQYFKNYC